MRAGREADLVVDDEVDRAAGAVARQAGEAEALGHDALAGERGVAVEQQRQHGRALAVLAAVLVLLGAHLAEHHRVDRSRGATGWRQREVDLVAVEVAVGRGAEVIFDVAGAADVVGLGRAARELVEDGAVRLAHDVGEHVEAAAVGHADDDLVDAELAAVLDDCSSAGTIASPPSRPKRLVPAYFLARNFSHCSASISLLRIGFLPSGVKAMSSSLPSIRSWMQAFCVGVDVHIFKADVPQ